MKHRESIPIYTALPVEKESLSQIVEAILFSSQRALTLRQIAKILDVKGTREIRRTINELNAAYEGQKRSFLICKVADGFQMRTDPQFKKWIQKGRIVRPVQLSPPALETLSIVAYNQPVTRAEIEDIRTVDATHCLRSLLDKNLIRITGKKEIVGRPLLYGTTKYFLEIFGFDNLSQLPHPENFDIVDATNDAEAP